MDKKSITTEVKLRSKLMKNQEIKNIWITGAGSGIGQGLACHYAAIGHKVFVSGRDQSKLDILCQLFPENIVSVVFDVSDSDQVAVCKEAIARRVNHLDMVILAAGICEYIDLPSMPVDTVEKVMKTNFLGCVNSFNVALPLMQHAGKKQIVGISSMAALLGFPRAQAYGASKAAMSYFLKSMRLELQAKNIEVITVNPGFIKTPLTDKNDFPMPFLRTVDEITKVIVQGIAKGKATINYPYRFYLLLNVIRAVPSLWYRCLGPRMSRGSN